MMFGMEQDMSLSDSRAQGILKFSLSFILSIIFPQALDGVVLAEGASE